MVTYKRELQIKPGYIEKTDATGEHYYAPTSEEQRIQNIESSTKLHDAKIEAESDQVDFLEECLVEMANILYAE